MCYTYNAINSFYKIYSSNLISIFLILYAEYKNHFKLIDLIHLFLLSATCCVARYLSDLEGLIMELLQLQYFKTIAECQHITNAANKLMISQPSLSNTLSRIESELGVKLFDRQGRNIVLNNYGRIVLEHTNNILRELDNIRTEIDELGERQRKVITIASVDSLYLLEWLPEFISQNQDIAVRHYIATAEQIETGLLNGSFDFGILSQPPIAGDLACLNLWQDELAVLVPFGSPLSSSTVRNFSEFEHEPFVAISQTGTTTRSIDIMSKAVGIKPNIVFEGERELIDRVMIPMKASILVLESMIRTEKDFSLIQKYCSLVRLTNPEAHLHINLAWDRRRSLPNSANRLLNYLKEKPASAWHLSAPDFLTAKDGDGTLTKFHHGYKEE